MLTDQKITEIYEASLSDENIFNNLLNDPQSLQEEFNLTKSDITDLVEKLNQAVSTKDILRHLKDITDEGPVIIPLPPIWQVHFELKLKKS